MGFARNPMVLRLLSQSYGQKGAVALPNADGRGLPLGRFPAGVDDVLNHLGDRYAEWDPATREPLEWCFLIGGPGNGKSEALRVLAGALQVALPPKVGGAPAPRTIPVDWPAEAASIRAGLDIVFVNDASIPRAGGGSAAAYSSLSRDLTDAMARVLGGATPTIVFASVNRGILIEEQAALRASPGTATVDLLIG